MNSGGYRVGVVGVDIGAPDCAGLAYLFQAASYVVAIFFERIRSSKISARYAYGEGAIGLVFEAWYGFDSALEVVFEVKRSRLPRR